MAAGLQAFSIFSRMGPKVLLGTRPVAVKEWVILPNASAHMEEILRGWFSVPCRAVPRQTFHGAGPVVSDAGNEAEIAHHTFLARVNAVQTAKHREGLAGRVLKGRRSATDYVNLAVWSV